MKSKRLAALALLTLAMSLGACSQLGLSSDSDETEEEDDEKKKKKSKKKKKKSKKKRADKDDGDDATDDGSIPAPKKGDKPSLRVGAWSKYKITGGAGGGEMTYAVLEKRNSDEYLVDADANIAPMPLQIQAWVQVKDLDKPSETKLIDLDARMNGKPLPGAMLNMSKQLWDKMMFNQQPPDFEKLPQEDVTVPAGTFRGCYRWKSKQKFMNIEAEATLWTHPAVPLPAFVKQTTDSDSTYELIAYGEKGAKRSF